MSDSTDKPALLVRHGPRLLAGVLAACGAAIPLGEGLAQICFGALALCFVGQRWLLPPRAAAVAEDAALPLAIGPDQAAGAPIPGAGWSLPAEPWRQVIGWSLAALLLALYLPVPLALWLGPGAPPSSELAKPLHLLALPLLLWAAGRVDEGAVRRLAWAFLAGLALACLIGLAQHFLAIRWGDQLLGATGFSGQREVPGDRGGVAATGTLFNRLKMAHVLVLGLGLALGLLLRGGPWSGRARLALAGSAALTMATLPFTFTRGALLAALVVLAAAAALGRRWGALVLVGGALALAVLMAASPATRQRALSVASGLGQYERAFLWARALETAAQGPVIGLGQGVYVDVAQRRYERVDPKVAYPWVRRHHKTGHHLLYTTWVEGGLLGLVALIVMLGAAAWGALARALRQRGVAAGLGAGALLAYAGLCVIGLIHDAFHHLPVLLGWCLLAALGLARPRRAS